MVEKHSWKFCRFLFQRWGIVLEFGEYSRLKRAAAQVKPMEGQPDLRPVVHERTGTALLVGVNKLGQPIFCRPAPRDAAAEFRAAIAAREAWLPRRPPGRLLRRQRPSPRLQTPGQGAEGSRGQASGKACAHRAHGACRPGEGGPAGHHVAPVRGSQAEGGTTPTTAAGTGSAKTGAEMRAKPGRRMVEVTVEHVCRHTATHSIPRARQSDPYDMPLMELVAGMCPACEAHHRKIADDARRARAPENALALGVDMAESMRRLSIELDLDAEDWGCELDPK